jgi:hypothetical protein
MYALVAAGGFQIKFVSADDDMAERHGGRTALQQRAAAQEEIDQPAMQF